ncbi:MAG: RagB/SusD family nutrient uptake outer membrane protein [Bacteroidaceae bacterium]|nr:RagB/SusD family nutrient uptake outer membrane protein [Bacteroidaceae bacterium]
MKKILNYTLISLAAMGLATSCNMDAPSQSTLDAQGVYSMYSSAEQAVMSIHVSFGETNSYRGRFLPYYGVNSDCEWIISGHSYKDKLADKNSLGNYATLANNGQMNTDNNAYAKFYEGIERANLAIEGLKKYGNIETSKDMGQLYGEALTLRAVIYSDLIKAWGDVPARFVPNSAENVYLPRCNRDSIYVRLLSDLLEAEDYCYWPNENKITSSTERVSKTFVKALRARIALQAGGYGQRANGYRRSTCPDLAPDKMYRIAMDECLSILENVPGSYRNTLGEFKDNFDKLCKDNVTAGGESIWEIPFSDGRGRVLYTWGVRHQAIDQYTGQAQGGVNGPLPTLFYDYDPEDIRRDITCVPYQWSKELVEGKSYQELNKMNGWNFGKLRYEWMSRYVTSTNDDGVNWQYMRLADVYLMAAEAINELEGPASAAKYMKPILDRALPANKVTELMAKYTASKNAFFQGIVDQRKFEFAGEALRKADLVRWGIIDEVMAEAKAKMRRLQNRTDEYAGYPDKLYFQLKEDGETLEIYGLEKGDTDEVGKALGWESKGWFVSNGVLQLADDDIDGLYVVDKPSEHCLWPIWQTFIDKGNGILKQELPE